MTTPPVEQPDRPDTSVISDDGVTTRLRGLALPSLPLTATDGEVVDLSMLPGRTVVYAYPRTSRPDQPGVAGWDAIPGARGCTPQSCAFRDHHAQLRGLGVERLYGLSTQDTDYQCEAVARLHLPFPLLSDSDLAFASALALPTFVAGGMTLLRRLTMIIDAGRIVHAIYPVVKPENSAQVVVDWLRSEHN